LFSDIAPITQLNLAAMSEDSKLALDDAVPANHYPFAIARNVANARRPAQSRTWRKLTRRAKQDSLNQVIEIHAVIRTKEIRSRRLRSNRAVLLLFINVKPTGNLSLAAASNAYDRSVRITLAGFPNANA
jgi:hypothetical protein